MTAKRGGKDGPWEPIRNLFPLGYLLKTHGPFIMGVVAPFWCAALRDASDTIQSSNLAGVYK